MKQIRDYSFASGEVVFVGDKSDLGCFAINCNKTTFCSGIKTHGDHDTASDSRMSGPTVGFQNGPSLRSQVRMLIHWVCPF